MDNCTFCGKLTNTTHHLIFGVGRRRLADEDKLTIKACDNCHNIAMKPEDRIHGNPMAEKLSKMLGQALWEKKYIELNGSGEERAKFIERYGRSYL